MEIGEVGGEGKGKGKKERKKTPKIKKVTKRLAITSL